MKTIDAAATTPAPRNVVWELIADKSAWPRWGRWSSVEIEGGADHGPGAVRVLVQRPFRVRERVTEWQPGARMSYELLDGMNARGYRASAILEDAPGGGTVDPLALRVRVGGSGDGIPAPHRRPRYRQATREGRRRLASAPAVTRWTPTKTVSGSRSTIRANFSSSPRKLPSYDPLPKRVAKRRGRSTSRIVVGLFTGPKWTM